MFQETHKRIHRVLRKHHPKAVEKAKKLVSFKYPKLLIMLLFILLSYYIFTRPFIPEIISLMGDMDYIGVFLAGFLVAFGFSAPFGIGLLINMDPGNILFATFIGGLGATITDLFIFNTIKFSFMDEFKKLEKTKIISKIENIVKNNKHVLIKHYLLYIFAGIVIATPLPDEIGVSMLAGLTTIKPVKLAVISFLLHSFTIFLLLYFF